MSGSGAPQPPPTEADSPAVKGDSPANDSSDVRQLLGIKGASESTSKWRIRLQLMKPVTWVPLIWGVTCGAAASGNFHWNDPVDIEKSLACMFLAGPLLTGYTQVINDWYDREIDAINEPYRPIPAGLVTENEVKTQIGVLLAAGLALAAGLDVWAAHEWPVNFTLTVFGVFVAYIYSAPPLKLKQNGWTGSYALGASYISLPWWAGQALFGTLDWKTMVLTLFYSFAGLGIAIINDFKSVEGDRATGMQSLPVMFGIDTAKWICVGMIDIFQLLVAGILFGVGEKGYAAAIVALVAPQMFLQQKYFLKDPVKYDVKYQASAQPFLVIGILVAGLAVGHHGPL
ncbi:chlorophyll a synthase [Chondrus crispus]|uniref:Chlorophyll a synthase n=1 Tax=Chondrus crispus TaxID=2769 RepID=R7QL79_CHOCR|nr:chlorophyll a synthase [Chondrus crispus]CDF38236.1 chlorophyll a synthase [Chondrus crispus]|eukprot:XP_005718121.1 chlorophyll a synthase [Chondrus crispus]